MPDEINTSTDSVSSSQASAPTIQPLNVPATTPTDKFKLEKIDNENVKKIDSRPDVTVLHIPTLEKQKAEIEDMMTKLQSQLDQINEVLGEFKKLP